MKDVRRFYDHEHGDIITLLYLQTVSKIIYFLSYNFYFWIPNLILFVLDYFLLSNQSNQFNHLIWESNYQILKSALRKVDHGFKLWSGQTTDFKIGISWFSSEHTIERSKNKDWLAQNQDYELEWSDMSTHNLLFQSELAL